MSSLLLSLMTEHYLSSKITGTQKDSVCFHLYEVPMLSNGYRKKTERPFPGAGRREQQEVTVYKALAVQDQWLTPLGG
jgi:hypothetical protein